MDQRQSVMLRAMADAVTERLAERLKPREVVSPVTVEAPQVRVDAPHVTFQPPAPPNVTVEAPNVEVHAAPAPSVQVDAPQIRIQAPPAPNVTIDVGAVVTAVDALTRAVKALADAQHDQNRVLAELVKAIQKQKPPQVTVQSAPRKALRLRRTEDGATIEEA